MAEGPIFKVFPLTERPFFAKSLRAIANANQARERLRSPAPPLDIPDGSLQTGASKRDLSTQQEWHHTFHSAQACVGFGWKGK